VEPGRSAVRGAQHGGRGAQEVVQEHSQVTRRPAAKGTRGGARPRRPVPGRERISERARPT
jgi:hypothetical protein